MTFSGACLTETSLSIDVPSRPTRHRSHRNISAYPAALAADSVLITRPDFNVRLADSADVRRHAASLIRRMYATRGYRFDANELPASPHQVTFMVHGESEAIGTLTLRFDSADGLLAAQLYGPELEACRGRHELACELAWFAFDPQQGTKELLASLFHVVYIYARLLRRATQMFIEVNPRHAGFYRRALGFRVVGPERVCQRVGAPAVFLCLDLAYADQQIERFGGRGEPIGRTLYPYCLSAIERENLYQRIVEMA